MSIKKIINPSACPPTANRSPNISLAPMSTMPKRNNCRIEKRMPGMHERGKTFVLLITIPRKMTNRALLTAFCQTSGSKKACSATPEAITAVTIAIPGSRLINRPDLAKISLISCVTLCSSCSSASSKAAFLSLLSIWATPTRSPERFFTSIHSTERVLKPDTLSISRLKRGS